MHFCQNHSSPAVKSARLVFAPEIRELLVYSLQDGAIRGQMQPGVACSF